VLGTVVVSLSLLVGVSVAPALADTTTSTATLQNQAKTDIAELQLSQAQQDLQNLEAASDWTTPDKAAYIQSLVGEFQIDIDNQDFIGAEAALNELQDIEANDTASTTTSGDNSSDLSTLLSEVQQLQGEINNIGNTTTTNSNNTTTTVNNIGNTTNTNSYNSNGQWPIQTAPSTVSQQVYQRPAQNSPWQWSIPTTSSVPKISTYQQTSSGQDNSFLQVFKHHHLW
jgi:hypothetical protein